MPMNRYLYSLTGQGLPGRQAAHSGHSRSRKIPGRDRNGTGSAECKKKKIHPAFLRCTSSFSCSSSTTRQINGLAAFSSRFLRMRHSFVSSGELSRKTDRSTPCKSSLPPCVHSRSNTDVPEKSVSSDEISPSSRSKCRNVIVSFPS